MTSYSNNWKQQPHLADNHEKCQRYPHGIDHVSAFLVYPYERCTELGHISFGARLGPR